MAPQRIGVVTGANKGIGFAIVRQLALQYPKSGQCQGRLLVYLTARDQSRGQSAVQGLHDDSRLKQARALVPDGGLTEIKFQPLDIADSGSIRTLHDSLVAAHADGIDFVVNNAGIALDGFDSRVVERTIRCNYDGTLEATESFLPLLKAGGRVVNVASMAGRLAGKYGRELEARFREAESIEQVSALTREFADAVERGKEKEEGWPSSAYAVSKAAEIALTRVIAEREKARGKRVLINSCCPGSVVTDMSKGRGHKNADQGAQTPVMLALGDVGGKTGLFWQDEQVAEW